MTSSGIKPAIFRLVDSASTNYATACPNYLNIDFIMLNLPDVNSDLRTVAMFVNVNI
jgi:hypothetical protein